MNLYLTLDAFPEVPDTLSQLRKAGLKIAILSNGTQHMLDTAVRNARIEGYFDAVLSVDDVGVYKPHPNVYKLAVDRLGIKPSAIAFQSSNGWDAYSAAAYGMRVVWCNRYGQRPERLSIQPDRVITSLAELPSIVCG